MPSVFMNEGLQQANDVFLGRSGGGNLILRPFINNITPTNDSVMADFVFPSMTGIYDITLDPGEWTVGVSAGVYTAEYPNPTLIFDSYAGPEETVYGFVVVDTDHGIALWAQLLASEFEIPLAGDTLTLALLYMDGACPT